MVTLAAAPTSMPATQPAADVSTFNVVFNGIVITLAIAGLLVAVIRYGILRPSKVAGPDRTPWPLGVWPLWIGFGASIVGLFVVTFFIIAVTAPQPPPKTEKAQAETEISDSDLAIRSVVPPVITCMLVAGMLVQMSPGTLSRIGMTPRTLPRGILLGVLAAVVIIPWIFIAGDVLDRIYQWTEFKHPGEHELLRVMNTKESLLKWLAITGAVVVAPICEEFIFRGLLQTAITEGILRLLDPRRGQPVAAAVVEQPVTAPVAEMPHAMLPGAPPQTDSATPISPQSPQLAIQRSKDRRPWAAWIGILMTSSLFALVHPLWTTPLIFVLAVGLGYVYERTGKLWVPMTIHAMFNIVNTTIYLFLH